MLQSTVENIQITESFVNFIFNFLRGFLLAHDSFDRNEVRILPGGKNMAQSLIFVNGKMGLKGPYQVKELTAVQEAIVIGIEGL